MFFFAGIAQEQESLVTLLLVVNAIIVAAIPLTIWAYRITREETRWLTKQLDEL